MTRYHKPTLKNWRFVSYFTKEYSDASKFLRKSLDNFDVGYDVLEVNDLGSWDANTHYKPDFLIDMYHNSPKDMVYIDADAELVDSPDLFDFLNCDISFWKVSTNRGGYISSGTLYLKKNKKVLSLLDEWSKQCKENQNQWEQLKLTNVVKNIPDLNIQLLPMSYCAIFDYPGISEIKPVIKHYQHSRKIRRKNG